MWLNYCLFINCICAFTDLICCQPTGSLCRLSVTAASVILAVCQVCPRNRVIPPLDDHLPTTSPCASKLLWLAIGHLWLRVIARGSDLPPNRTLPEITIRHLHYVTCRLGSKYDCNRDNRLWLQLHCNRNCNCNWKLLSRRNCNCNRNCDSCYLRNCNCNCNRPPKL